jgi:dienelactone hydrolase
VASATLAERCFVDGPGDLEPVRGPDGSSLTSVAYGSGPSAVVLLHQTGAGGLCGWVPFARWLAEQGVFALAVDDCVHGASRCTPEVAADTRAQVAIAVDRARAQGASAVAVVGASMGGARALGVGQAAGADAVVDLSGPDRWDGVPDAVAAGRATSVPLLVVSSDGDTGIDGDLLDAAVDASPARVKDRWRLPGDRHGWDVVTDGIGDDAVVTPEGPRLLAWLRGALER